MGKRLFVSNLSYTTNAESLQAHFANAGLVTCCQVITDRETGRSRGFGFVEMSSDEEFNRALTELNEKEFEGRKLFVQVARERSESAPGPSQSSYN